MYSKKNIEKVKRDEAKAEEKLKLDQDRIQLAVKYYYITTIRHILTEICKGKRV